VRGSSSRSRGIQGRGRGFCRRCTKPPPLRGFCAPQAGRNVVQAEPQQSRVAQRMTAPLAGDVRRVGLIRRSLAQVDEAANVGGRSLMARHEARTGAVPRAAQPHQHEHRSCTRAELRRIRTERNPTAPPKARSGRGNLIPTKCTIAGAAPPHHSAAGPDAPEKNASP
jgi:hypothetical protein